MSHDLSPGFLRRDKPSASITASCWSRRIRSCPSSKATAPARTSGAPRCASSTPPSRRPTAGSGASPGWRSSPVRKSFDRLQTWLPDETVEAFREFLVGIKGPLTTPIGGGIRSLNVALRKALDLYVCQRPVRYFEGVPSPVKHPEDVDMVIFRENTEDLYTGIEFEAGRRRQPGLRSLAGARPIRPSSPRSASRPAPPSASSRSRGGYGTAGAGRRCAGRSTTAAVR